MAPNSFIVSLLGILPRMVELPPGSEGILLRADKGVW